MTLPSTASRREKQRSRVNLTRDAYNDIRKLIFMNELRPGQKVAYRDMAKRLGMSLTPVVQALKHMEFLGLLNHVPNRGFFIKSMDVDEISEAFELRELLEVNLIPSIVDRLDQDSEKRLNQVLAEYLDAGQSGSIKLRLAKDMRFHMTMAEISRRPMSIWLLRYLLDFLYLRFEKEQIFSRPQESAALEHRTIVDTIHARDTTGAKKAMRDHLRSVKKNVMRDLRKRLKETEEIEI